MDNEKQEMKQLILDIRRGLLSSNEHFFQMVEGLEPLARLSMTSETGIKLQDSLRQIIQNNLNLIESIEVCVVVDSPVESDLLN